MQLSRRSNPLRAGPAYQPINDFLRAVGQLQGVHRSRLVTDAATTFAATVASLCSAIRKLAAVTSPGEAKQPLYRGVRGELPKAFWVADKQGMVCAVDMAFMSTSRNRKTPIDYMGSGKNVLWELCPKAQSDAAYHRGAEIKMLSQFAYEDEVLFPPCTMLEVQRSAAFSGEAEEDSQTIKHVFERADTDKDGVLSLDEFEQLQRASPEATSQGKRRGSLEEHVPRYLDVRVVSEASKRFIVVKVLPSFV